jgi:hypothetical protein
MPETRKYGRTGRGDQVEVGEAHVPKTPSAILAKVAKAERLAAM